MKNELNISPDQLSILKGLEAQQIENELTPTFLEGFFKHINILYKAGEQFESSGSELIYYHSAERFNMSERLSNTIMGTLDPIYEMNINVKAVENNTEVKVSTLEILDQKGEYHLNLSVTEPTHRYGRGKPFVLVSGHQSRKEHYLAELNQFEKLQAAYYLSLYCLQSRLHKLES